MPISTHTGLVGFLLTLSAVTATVTTSQAASATAAKDAATTVEARLSRLTEAIRQLETQRPEGVTLPEEIRVAGGFANRGGGGGGFANRSGGGGWVNGGGGGGFYNAWRNGGGFINRW